MPAMPAINVTAIALFITNVPYGTALKGASQMGLRFERDYPSRVPLIFLKPLQKLGSVAGL